MAWGSTVPAALTGLATAFAAAAPGTTVQKLPIVGASARQEVIQVGAKSDMAAAVTANPELADYSLSQREKYTVNCQIEVASGGVDPDTVTARAFVLLAAVGGALVADQTLGGAVMSAQLGPWDLVIHQMPKGVRAILAFSVDVDAFVTR